MILVMKQRLLGLLLMLMSVALAGAATDLEDALEAAQELVATRRYQDAIELLETFEKPKLDAESRYILNAEIGRCCFHLGNYPDAHRRFKTAVTLHPERVETALYLEATSFLLGDTDQALLIFENILKSEARDLYLAVTLPGERQFLQEKKVWNLLDRYSQDITVNVEEASVLGVRIGDKREHVIARLGAGSANADAPALSAQAGPRTIWAFSFSEDGLLSNVIFQSENMVRYTPYRLKLDNGLDWRMSPAAAISVFGNPGQSHHGEDHELTLTWTFESATLALTFGPALEPAHPKHGDHAAMLKLLHLYREGSDPRGSIKR
jgi:tetratricopeptide (TPR) repeat protein